MSTQTKTSYNARDIIEGLQTGARWSLDEMLTAMSQYMSTNSSSA